MHLDAGLLVAPHDAHAPLQVLLALDQADGPGTPVLKARTKLLVKREEDPADSRRQTWSAGSLPETWIAPVLRLDAPSQISPFSRTTTDCPFCAR